MEFRRAVTQGQQLKSWSKDILASERRQVLTSPIPSLHKYPPSLNHPLFHLSTNIIFHHLHHIRYHFPLTINYLLNTTYIIPVIMWNNVVSIYNIWWIIVMHYELYDMDEQRTWTMMLIDLVNKNLFPRERVGVFHVVRTTLVGSPSEGSSACFWVFWKPHYCRFIRTDTDVHPHHCQFGCAGSKSNSKGGFWTDTDCEIWGSASTCICWYTRIAASIRVSFHTDCYTPEAFALSASLCIHSIFRGTSSF